MSVAAYHRSAREAEIEQTIRDGVIRLHGKVWHVRDSRRKDVTDMPDLLIVLPPTVALIEIKSQRRDLTPGQAGVMEMLDRCNRLLAGVVRPEPRPGEMSLDEALHLLTGGME